MELLRKRNTATTIYFPVIVAGSNDFATSSEWTPASGDVQFSVDGGTFANTNTATPTHEGNGIWSLALLGTEVNGKVTVITIVDSATKAIEDQAILIATYGDSSSQHDVNIVADHVLRRSLASAAAGSDGDSVIFRSILGGIRKLVNKIAVSGSTLTIYQEDDTSSAGTQAITSSAAADPITELDTT